MSYGGHAGLQYGIGKGTYPVIYHENNVHYNNNKMKSTLTPTVKKVEKNESKSVLSEGFVGYQ